MIKKKTSKKGNTGKKGTRKKRTSRSKKDLNPAEVRKDISRIVTESSVAIAQAVVGAAKMGQLAPAKYMWEMTGIYPAVTDVEQSTSEEDSLAKTLLDRLNLPTEPVKLDEEDEPAVVVIPAKKELSAGEKALVDGESESKA